MEDLLCKSQGALKMDYIDDDFEAEVFCLLGDEIV